MASEACRTPQDRDLVENWLKAQLPQRSPPLTPLVVYDAHVGAYDAHVRSPGAECPSG